MTPIYLFDKTGVGLKIPVYQYIHGFKYAGLKYKDSTRSNQLNVFYDPTWPLVPGGMGVSLLNRNMERKMKYKGRKSLYKIYGLK